MEVVPGFAMAETALGGRAYVLAAGGTCVVIDTGAPDGTLGVGKVLEEMHRRPHEVRLILLTHAHRGHAGNAAALHELTGAPVAASTEAATALNAGVPAARGWRRLLGGAGPVPPLPRVRALEPGEHLDLAGGIEVIGAPGHATGHLAFHLRGPDVLCIGDAGQVDATGLRPPPEGRCQDGVVARATAERLAALPARVVAPGHGYPLVEGRLPQTVRGGGQRSR